MQPMVVAAKDAQKKAFSERLHEAIDRADDAPRRTERGRAPWLARVLKNKFKLTLSPQGITKWLEGHSIPDQTHLSMICKAIGVNQQWLATGDNPTWSDTKAPPARSALYSERELLLLQAFRDADPKIQQAAERVLGREWQEAPQENEEVGWKALATQKK
jgi:hypothetical protein